MFDWFVIAILFVAQGLIFGFATQSVIENKGYEENWFWLGFFFGVVVLIVANAKPQVYDYNTYKKPADQIMASGGWKCTCGEIHASYVSSCSCGRDKWEVLHPQNTKKLEKTREQEKELDEMGKVSAIKEYKALMDEGIITQEEFEAKKKQLLGL